MIIVDYNAVVIANVMVSLREDSGFELQEGLIRHMVLKSLLTIRKKFANDGELVLATDAKNSWRYDVFPYYKASRKDMKDDSFVDWDELHRILSKVRQEISDYMPYKVLHIERCEADDIIGVLVKYKSSFTNERNVIVSGDKDFIQLQRYPNTIQYDKVRDRYLESEDPDQYLLEHIAKGDRGDGIPNIRSDITALVNKVRQKPITKKYLENLDYDGAGLTDEEKSRFLLNKTLIDLSHTPDYLVDEILAKFLDEKGPWDAKITVKYFIDSKLKELMENVYEY